MAQVPAQPGLPKYRATERAIHLTRFLLVPKLCLGMTVSWQLCRPAKRSFENNCVPKQSLGTRVNRVGLGTRVTGSAAYRRFLRIINFAK